MYERHGPEEHELQAALSLSRGGDPRDLTGDMDLTDPRDLRDDMQEMSVPRDLRDDLDMSVPRDLRDDLELSVPRDLRDDLEMSLSGPFGDEVSLHPSLRDREHLSHGHLLGGSQFSGNNYGTMRIKPAGGGAPPATSQRKTDGVLPAYCNPPNPCPLGYTGQYCK